MTKESSVSPGPEQASVDPTSLGSDSVQAAPTEWTIAADLLLTAMEGRAQSLAKKAAESIYEELLYNVQDYLRENTLWNLKHELEMANRLADDRWQTLRGIAELLGVHTYPASEITDAIDRLKAKAAVGGSSPSSSDASPTSGRAPK